MSDNEDPNARRAARPSTPPFRGPAGPAGRPPLAPQAGGQGGTPAAPKPGAARHGSGAPFALPPAGPRRPATPAQGSRQPAATPPGTQPAPRPTPARPASATPSEADIAAIPAYGSAPPPSVAATLKSISEFTIVEEPAEAPVAPEQAPSSGYEPPTLTARVGEPDPTSEAYSAEPGGAAGAPAGDTGTGALATLADAASDAPYAPSLADTVEWRATPPDLDAMVTVPPLEADRAVDAAAAELTPTTLLAVGMESNDDVIAAAFDAGPTSMFADPGAAPGAPAASEESGLIGGSPESRYAAECLEEIARAIRAGEVAAPAVHPEADHAAVLAAVLATLLAPRA